LLVGRFEDRKEKVRTFLSGRGRSYWCAVSFWLWGMGGGGVHKCVWEAHFGAVYDAIPYTFYQCEDVVVLGVKDDLLQR
jgi:hypothetical protein